MSPITWEKILILNLSRQKKHRKSTRACMININRRVHNESF